MSEQTKKPAKKSIASRVGSILGGIFLVAAIGAILAIKLSGTCLYLASGDSMMPNIQDGDYMVINPVKNIERFDVVTMQDPRTSDVTVYVKRIIGLPGDEISVIDGHLYINGEYYEEPYLDEKHTAQFASATFRVRVPQDSYFVLGDNRDASTDSRDFGEVFSEDVIGAVLVQWKGR